MPSRYWKINITLIIWGFFPDKTWSSNHIKFQKYVYVFTQILLATLCSYYWNTFYLKLVKLKMIYLFCYGVFWNETRRYRSIGGIYCCCVYRNAIARNVHRCVWGMYNPFCCFPDIEDNRFSVDNICKDVVHTLHLNYRLSFNFWWYRYS